MQKLGNVLINIMQDLSRISTNGKAHIRVNGNVCDSETFETLFQYFAQGTILEHIDLDVEEMSPQAECVCGYTEDVGASHDGYIRCPQCGKYADVKDRAYQIEKPDPQKTQLRQSRTFQ
jgi:Zn finger protein HypA/HybF involved in hydrogenase expression